MPRVFIIILNWNGLQDTLECLSSLKKIDYKNYKIIVVDNGSKDRQADKIKAAFPSIIAIRNKTNKGYSEANNQGITLALKKNADYVLLLNNDTVVIKNFLSKLVYTAEKNKKVGIASPKILYYKSDLIWSMGGNISYTTGISVMIGKKRKSSEYTKLLKPGFITGCCMLIKKEVVNKIGLLDAGYFAYYEDADYSFQARSAGFDLLVVPESIIRHKKSASVGIRGSDKITPVQSYLWARNGIIFGKKRLTGINKSIFILNQFFIKFLFCSMKFSSFESFLNYVKGLYHGIINKELSHNK